MTARNLGERSTWRDRLRALRRDERGATIVEFGFIAFPFFALLCAIIETALIFLSGQILDSAMHEAARMIRTGQAQQQGFTKSRFKQEVCAHLLALVACDEKLHIDVRKYPSFANPDLSNPIDKNGNFVDNFQYDPGKGSEIVVVRAYYEWPLIFNRFGFQLDNLANGRHLLGSVTAFRNEPFPW